MELTMRTSGPQYTLTGRRLPAVRSETIGVRIVQILDVQFVSSFDTRQDQPIVIC